MDKTKTGKTQNGRAEPWSSICWLSGLPGCQYFNYYVRPTITPHKTAGTHQNSRRKSREGTHNKQLERGERETGRDTVSTMGEAASKPLMAWALWILTLPLEPSPWWTRAPVPVLLLLLLLHAAGVEVVSAPNREGTQDPLRHLFSAGSLSKHHVWNNTNRCVHEYLRL